MCILVYLNSIYLIKPIPRAIIPTKSIVPSLSSGPAESTSTYPTYSDGSWVLATETVWNEEPRSREVPRCRVVLWCRVVLLNRVVLWCREVPCGAGGVVECWECC